MWLHEYDIMLEIYSQIPLSLDAHFIFFIFFFVGVICVCSLAKLKALDKLNLLGMRLLGGLYFHICPKFE